MAVEAVTGATPAWFVEYDAAPSKILAHHWPDVPNYGDVTKVDWAAMPPVDILTGGYPCQPFSQAGQRKGTNDDRHLWPYVREAIRVLRPRLVLLENVAGHRSLGFDRVLGDMAEDGLHVRWTSLRASDIGAPHHRERLFILASPGESGQDVADPHRVGSERSVREHRSARRPTATGNRGTTTDAEGARRDHGSAPHVGPPHRKVDAPRDDSHAATDTEDDGLARARPARHRRTRPADSRSGDIDWGPYTEAVQRWEGLTRPAPAPTEPNTKGNPRLNAEFASWMMGLPEGHVTQVPSISRADQLKAIGNGVCPQQAAAAIHQLLTSPAPAGHFS